MADKIEIKEILVPKELVVKSSGLGLDYGGSIIKMVYRTEADYKEASDPGNTSNNAKLHLAHISREFKHEALQFLYENAYVKREGDQLPKVFTTGCGSTEYTQDIIDTVKIMPQIITEHDCFAKSLHFLLTHMSREELLFPIIREAMEENLKFCEELHALIRQMSGLSAKTRMSSVDLIGQLESEVAKVRAAEFNNLPPNPRPVAEAEDIFPCMMGILGSAFCFFLINADGTFKAIDATQIGGRYFHGLGSILTGSKSYSELIALAEKGNHRNVDTHRNDMNFNTGKNDLAAKFGAMETDSLVFSFGKGVGKTAKDFKPEDLARALLRAFIKEKAEKIRLTAAHHEVKHVFLTGSFVQDEIVRRTFTDMFTFCNYYTDTANMRKLHITKYDFVKGGSHLGALGTLINSVENFIPSAK